MRSRAPLRSAKHRSESVFATPLLMAGGPPMDNCKWLGAIILSLTATLAQGAGIRSIDIPANVDGPELKGAVWYPCSQPPEGLISAGSPCRGGRIVHCPTRTCHLS